ATRTDMDHIADFSSRGPAGFSPSYTKPEVCAPGVNILSLGLSGGYVRKSGTSMATPFVSGIAALMLEANSSLTPYQLRDALESTAIDLGEQGADNTYGWGRVDAWEAVNANTPLEPSTSFTSGQFQLFGGSLTDDVLVSFPILDPEGDVVGADVLAAGLDISSSASTADFFIITKSTPDPSVCEYRVYVDVDNNTSTGFPVCGTGVDYWLVVNSTSNVLFDANGTVMSSDVAWEVGDHTLWLQPLRAQMGITDIQSPMRFFVQAECKGEVDTAPDRGYGAYPYQIEVGSFAVVWNTSSRVPAPNESVRFELYGWDSAAHAYDILMGSLNTTTNDRGYANASFVCTPTSTGGDALVKVSVEDISVEDTIRWYAAPPAPEPMFTPTLTPSYAVCRDGVLNVSYTLVASDFTPYEHEVALVFGTPVVGYPHVQVNLTPHNGTVSYSLNLNETSLDNDPSFEIYLLNGTVESHDYHVWAGRAVVVEDSTRTLSVLPSFSRSPPHDNTTFLVLTGRLYDDAPLAREVGVDVYWLSEAEVKQLSTSASSWLYPHLKGTERNPSSVSSYTCGLSAVQLEHLQELVEENTSNLKYPVEHTALATNSYGVGTLNLTPPVGAYFGLVVLRDGELEQRAAVLVQDPHLYDNLFASPALPTVDVSVQWYAEYNGSAWNGEPQLTVSVEMYYLNESTLVRVPVVNEPLHLVLSTGEVEDVLTDTWGRARAVFSAPKLDDIVNTTPIDPEGYVGISAWSVGAIVVSNRADESGGMLTATAYGPVQATLSQRRAISGVSYAPSTLVANISWEDERGMPASGVPTVLDVVRKTPARDHVLEVLLSTYINDSGMSHTESVGVEAFGEYSASATTRENTLRGSTTVSDEDGVSVMPVKVVSDIAERYPLNGTFDVHVKVSHLNETPVSSALVYISQSAGHLQTDPAYNSYVAEPPAWSSLDINHTDASGTAVLRLRTPPQDASVAWVIGVSTGEKLFPYAREGTLNASNNIPPVPVHSLNHTVSNVGSATYFNSSLSYDVDGSIVARMWEFGDGISDYGVLAEHSYTDYIWEGGAYQHFGATLSVRDSGGFTNTTHIPVVVYMAGDANGDGVANVLDAALVGLHWNARYGAASYHDGADLNNDDVVNILDAALTGLNWNMNAGGM
ncbi:MAG: S8 family serine peptidase, partial [Methermicoccaceae archaeon]